MAHNTSQWKDRRVIFTILIVAILSTPIIIQLINTRNFIRIEYTTPYLTTVPDPLESEKRLELSINLKSATFAAHTGMTAFVTLYLNSTESTKYTYHVLFDNSSCSEPPVQGEFGKVSECGTRLNPDDKERPSNYTRRTTITYTNSGTYPVSIVAKSKVDESKEFRSTSAPVIHAYPLEAYHNFYLSRIDANLGVYSSLGALAAVIITAIWFKSQSNNAKKEPS